MRLIDADLAIDKIHGYDTSKITELIDFLSSCPTVRLENMSHGHWILKYKHVGDTMIPSHLVCSVCGQVVSDRQANYKFCPGCGAIMDDGYTEYDIN